MTGNSLRRVFALLASTVLLVALIAVPAGAKQAEPVGDLVKLFYDDDNDPGNQWTIGEWEPFHIVHGHDFLGHGRKNYLLPMTVDEVLLEPDAIKVVQPYVDFWGVTNTSDSKSMQRLWNFPDGLPAGEYTVVGTWSYPCVVAVAFDFYAGECEHPNDLWEQGSLTLELSVVALGE